MKNAAISLFRNKIIEIIIFFHEHTSSEIFYQTLFHLPEIKHSKGLKILKRCDDILFADEHIHLIYSNAKTGEKTVKKEQKDQNSRKCKGQNP